jgi:hypothetical protein
MIRSTPHSDKQCVPCVDRSASSSAPTHYSTLDIPPNITFVPHIRLCVHILGTMEGRSLALHEEKEVEGWIVVTGGNLKRHWSALADEVGMCGRA